MPNDQFKLAVESRLAEFLAQQQKQALTSEASLMLQRIEQLILRDGKRSRPLLLKSTYEAYGGQDIGQLVDIGAALELHHQFLLIHDDIMDNDTIRYNGPNITGYYQTDYLPEAPEIPASMALLAGNVLFSYACQLLQRHPSLTTSRKLQLLNLLQDINIGVHAGQQLDIVNIYSLQPNITEAKLLLTNELKTALYSILLPMRSAAVLLDIPAKELAKIETFAKNFGVLYQLMDDHSDYFVNASKFNNHPKFRDFCQGKITYPLLQAFELASKSDQDYLRQHIGQKDTTKAVLSKVVAILERCGAAERSQALVAKYYTAAVDALAKLAITPEARQQFTKLITSYKP